ncbi:hypothetical protein IHE45_07G130200 [Dioscorea alata]|uniref:Uncharacterized protein n=1 Tax=Dioscorea alata TaxID=55571 RepID=A0ACB7VUB1_DIOAL|nr:hypothetical protein IHE45_07G130200 [Dioscorea alata]
MAEMNGLRSSDSSSMRGQPHSGGFEVQDQCPTTMTSNFEDYPDHHQAKKSVLAKVKEKALKWRNLLAKKKQVNDKANETPAWGVSLEEEDDDDDDEQNPEFRGAPMYESERAPEAYQGGEVKEHKKPPVLLHRNPAQELAMKHVDELALHHLDEFIETSTPRSNSKPVHDDLNEEKARCLAPHPTPTHDLNSETKRDNTIKKSASQKTLTEAVSKILAPACNMVSDATQTIVSKLQHPSVDEEIGSKMKYDKGVSVKEFVLQKLEPGEDDKALSKVITESMSPRKSNQAGEKGVMEKFREAVSSLLGKQEDRKTPIPLSTNPQEVDVK